MNHSTRLALTAVFALLVLNTGARADVSLPAIIGDNMVLQQGLPLAFWGTADAGEQVQVEVGKNSARATADGQGHWLVRLEPTQQSGPIDVTIRGRNTITLKNVLVGEVWICSGQSNMEWPVSRAKDAEAEIAGADNPRIRLFVTEKFVAAKPRADTTGQWVECRPDSVDRFSAVGYFFGRQLHEALDRPIGLVQSVWGGTPAEAWTSREMLESHEILHPILDRWDEIVSDADEIQQKYEASLAQWQKEARQAKQEGRPAPQKPRPPRGPRHPHRASGLYNGMIAPLVPYTIRGAIWYQGESNASRAYQYRTLFSAMIEDWRNTWKQGDFPFLFVQLANFRQAVDEPGESDWAELREAQTMALSLPDTAMAVTIDIGEADDIHPRNKQDVGRRLALAAGAVAYGHDQVYSGPMFRSMTKANGQIRLEFDHVGGGLVARGGELTGFAIAGADRNFKRADARIEGTAVVVSSEPVDDPVAVRYGWADNPSCNLYNTEGLPASPFRTDDWPGVTVDAR